MPFWLLLLLFVATTVVGELLQPKGQKPTAGALGDFQFPTASEGRAIPYVCGSVLIKGGNTTWWGDLKIVAIKVRASIISFTRQTTGYKYLIGVQYMLCHGPVDALTAITVDDKGLSYTTSTILNGGGTEDKIQCTISSEKLFGGTDVGGEGGISGVLDFYRGLTTQQPNDYLTRVQGRVIIDQSGLGYEYAGVGNGTLDALSGGAGALDETITITANHFDSGLGKEIFRVVGTVSGHIADAQADLAFSSDQINFTVTTGGTPYSTGDVFTVIVKHSSQAPAYKNLCYAVMRQVYVGTQPYPKPWGFYIRRCPDPFAQGNTVANIGGDGNGVLAIYELMTNNFYGLGILPQKFDADAFKAAAVVVAGEGLGLSFQLDSSDQADTHIQEILRHIDGVIYTDPATGLWTIKLARADYDPDTIPVLDQSSIKSIDFSRGSWSETFNSVTISYLSRAANYNERTTVSYDPGNINVTREVRPSSMDFKFLSNETAASLVAMRVLKTVGYPIGKLKIEANRLAWNFRMGGVFKMNWDSLGIASMIFRITHIAYGELRDGTVSIDSVEDIFGINEVAFTSPPESGWVNPLGAPAAPSQQELWEIPYRMLVQAAIPPGRYMAALAARGDVSSKTFQIWRSGVEIIPLADFTPIGTLLANYTDLTHATDTTGITIHNLLDTDGIATPSPLDYAAGNFLILIDDELMAVGTVTPGTGTLALNNIVRGVLDTVRSTHSAGAIVWFLAGGVQATETAAEPADNAIAEKFLPENTQGVYPIGSATTLNKTYQSRFLRPYPPGNLRVGAGAWGSYPSTLSGDLVMTWSDRNRLTQTSIVAQDATAITSEAGVTDRIRIFVGATLMHDVSGLVTGYTYSSAQRIADDPDLTKLVTIELRSTNGTLDSLFSTGFVLQMLGDGSELLPGSYEYTTVDVGGISI